MRPIVSLKAPPRFGVGVVAVLTGFSVAVPGVAAIPADPQRPEQIGFVIESADACLDSEEIAFLGLVNDHRALSGLGPLSVSASLSAAAAFHSVDMANSGYLSHTMSDGTSVTQNMANFGYQGSAHGENIAAGTGTAAEAMRIWQGSGPHNANMLNGQFGAIGIGRAYDASSSHGWYWTTIFGDVSDGPGWLCGESAPPSKSVSLFQSVDGATAASDINLRSGPAETYELVATLPPGTEMTVTGAVQQSYVPVKVDGQFGWVAAEWITRGPISLQQTAEPQITGEPGTATVLDGVELRSVPGDQGGVISTIPAVSIVTLTGEAQDGFLGVVYDGQQGWADAAYLAVADTAGTATLLQSTEGIIGAQAVTMDNLNLRSQPNPNAMVIDIVPAGSQVSLTGSRANGYVNVRVGGQAGWLDERYLQ